MKTRLVKFTCPATNRCFEFVSMPFGTTDEQIDKAHADWLKSKTKADWFEEPVEPDMKCAASGERDDD